MKRRIDNTDDDLGNKGAKRWSGAGMYNTKYKESWKQKYTFVRPVTSNFNMFHCTVCNKNVSC
jgi:hypothetical protein